MKMFCISDSKDTKIGLRLSGVEGVVLKEKKEVENFLEQITKDKEIAIILITEKIFNLCEEKINKIKSIKKTPVFVKIPGKDGGLNNKNTLAKYIDESIGIKI